MSPGTVRARVAQSGSASARPRPRVSWTVSSEPPPAGWRQSAYGGRGRATTTGRRWTSTGRSTRPSRAGRLAGSRCARGSVSGSGCGSGAPTARESRGARRTTVEAGLLDAGGLDGAAGRGRAGRSARTADRRRAAAAPASSSSRRPRSAGPAVRRPRTACYELEINGARVGDDVLAPGWTSYHHRLRYQHLRRHRPAASRAPTRSARWLADGWYRGRLGFDGGTPGLYGDRLALLAQLEVDATPTATRPVVADGRLALRDRPDHRRSACTTASATTPGCDPTGWSHAGLRRRQLVAGRRASATTRRRSSRPTGPPVRRTETLRPVPSARRRPGGAGSVDFGQNLAGRLRIRVRRPGRATSRALRHAEVLQDGELVRPARCAARVAHRRVHPARRRDGRGVGAALHHPRLPLRRGRPAGPASSRPATSRRSSATPTCARTGWFACSDPQLEPAARERRVEHARQLRRPAHRLPAARRAARLDRRHPGLRARPRAFLYDCAGTAHLLAGRPRRRAATRRHGPALRPVDRRCDCSRHGPTAAWGDAAVVVPWALYQRYGDLGLLRAQYPSMTRLGRPGRRAGRARAACGTPASSSATGSTPPRRRTTRPAHAPTRTWSPPPTSPAPPGTWRETADVLGEADDHRRYPALAERRRGRLRRRVRHARRAG